MDAITALTPILINGLISRIYTPASAMQRHFGFEMGGKNVKRKATFAGAYTYDIFDKTRTAAKGVLRNAPASSINRQPIGRNTVQLGESREKLDLDYNEINGLRQLGGPVGLFDPMGKDYIEKQLSYLRQRQDNFREFMLGGVLRGGRFGFKAVGQELFPSYDFANCFVQVDLKVPPTHRMDGASYAAAVSAGGLTMGTGANLIDTSWSDPAANVLGNMDKVSAAFQGTVGSPLAEMLMSSNTFNNLLNNTGIIKQAGSSSTAFVSYDQIAETTEDGRKTGVRKATLKARQWIDITIYDGQIVIETNDAATRVLPDGYVTFLSEGMPGEALQLIEGTLVIKENDIAAPREIVGFDSWKMERADPARVELHTAMICGFELNRPSGIAWARVHD